jgi:hypothetical protein
MINSEEKDRGRLIGLVRKASSEDIQNHLDAFDGQKIIVDYDGHVNEEEDFDAEEAPPRGFSQIPEEHDRPFYDGLQG